MDSTLISDTHHLFAYCITDGLWDEMRPEQRASIISVIECLLSEGKDASACSKKKNNFFLPVRPNNSLLNMTSRTDWFK